MISDILTSKISDLKKLSEDKRSLLGETSSSSLGRKAESSKTGTGTGNSLEVTFADDFPPMLPQQTPTDLFMNTGDHVHFPAISNASGTGPVGRGTTPKLTSKPGSPSRKLISQQGAQSLERPASRMEILSLEHELEERVRLVLDYEEEEPHDEADFSTGGFTYQPQKETMALVRKRMLAEFNANPKNLATEPWLEGYVKCESLKVMCDEISLKLADMLSVNSMELGNVLRKLRLTYKQSFEQMLVSWKQLRNTFLDCNSDLLDCKRSNVQLKKDLVNKESEIQARFDVEVASLNEDFALERERDKEKLLQTEFKMDQMSETLKYLNGIFKTMQNDGGNMKSIDLQSKCQKLEKENKELHEKDAHFDAIKAQLAAVESKAKRLEEELGHANNELKKSGMQLQRREEVVAGLMEREELRNAEIEKLQKIANSKEKELMNIDMKDPATSVLCIKCKKSLDDIGNIRSAIMGDGSGGNGKNMRISCENLRILLPNLKNRRPNRSSVWLRASMRCILISKMSEDVSLRALRGQPSRFPAYVYSWFVRDPSNINSDGTTPSSSQLTKALAKSDDDRWGLYYGIKAFISARENVDPECALFWSLLDETYGNDGMAFVLHCLSTVLSLSGQSLWKQFGLAMSSANANLNVNHHISSESEAAAAAGPGAQNKKSSSAKAAAAAKSTYQTTEPDLYGRPYIWLDVTVAKEAVSHILVRALAPHVLEAMDAIDALRVRPNDEDMERLEQIKREVMGLNKPDKEQVTSDAAAAESEELGDEYTAAAQGGSSGDRETGDDADVEGGGGANDPTGSSEEENKTEENVADDTVTRSEDELKGKEELKKKHIKTILDETPTHINLFMWLRLMLQQMHADQIHRSAAVRLMFETASVGALTPAVSSGGSHGHEKIPTAFGQSATHVEFSQFQSICKTLFPNASIAEVAELYSDCYAASAADPGANGVRRVTSETFMKQADLKGLFAQSMRLTVLPVLHRAGTNIKPAPRLEAGARNSRKVTKDLASAKERLVKENAVRSRLSTLIHRKLASISPTILHIMRGVPERWKAMLGESLESVQQALKGAQSKIRHHIDMDEDDEAQQRQGSGAASSIGGLLVGSSANKSLQEGHFIDGLQPFVEYRRLLCIASLIKAMCDNPLLPTEIFSIEDIDTKGFNLNPAMITVEKQLTNLEQSLLSRTFGHNALKQIASAAAGSISSVGKGGSTNSTDGKLHKYVSFETVRRSILARKLQNVVRSHLKREVAVPRSVRMCMQPGYMGFIDDNHSRTKFLVKNREVIAEPWFGMSAIAEIYKYKLNYDCKAATLGLPPVALPNAIAAYFYNFWGSTQMADRAVHDLFVSVRTYRFGIPRFRMFAAFCGDGKELDESTASLLATPQALSVYLTVLLEVHRTLDEIRWQNERRREEQFRELVAMGVLDPEVANAPSTGVHSLPPYARDNVVDVLFPATENCFKRQDKREVWHCKPSVLKEVAVNWAANTQKNVGLHSALVGLYAELPDKLKTNADNLVEVDDFLWLLMQQWARLTSSTLRKVEGKASVLEDSLLFSPLLTGRDGSGCEQGPETSNELRFAAGDLPPMKKVLPSIPLANLRVLLESIYPVADIALYMDAEAVSASFIQRVGLFRPLHTITHETWDAVCGELKREKEARLARTNSGVDSFNVAGNRKTVSSVANRHGTESPFALAVNDLMRDCLLWDSNVCVIGEEKSHIHGLQVKHHSYSFAKRTFSNSSIVPVRSSVKIAARHASLGAHPVIAAAAAAAAAAVASGVPSGHSSEIAIANAVASVTSGSNASFVRSEHSLLVRTRILSAVNPEVTIMVAKKIYSTYNEILNEMIHKITNDEEITDVSAVRAGQSAGLMLLTLLDHFQKFELNYASVVIYKEEIGITTEAEGGFSASAVGDPGATTISKDKALEMSSCFEARAHNRTMAQEVSSLLHALMATVAELVLHTGADFPRDPWQGGMKLHVDRASVYNVQVKSSAGSAI